MITKRHVFVELSGDAGPEASQALEREGYALLPLRFEGREPVALTGEAGDVALFVSDVWHRRLPPGPGDAGRYFVQIHYGRRDLAQRLRPTQAAHQLSPEAVARATSTRDRAVVGLHDPLFYDG